MQKSATNIAAWLLISSVTFAAQPFKIGVHTGMPVGDMDDGIAYGAQAELGITEKFSIEIAGTTGQESDDFDLFNVIGAPGYMDIDATTFAGSLVFRQPLSDKISIFLLGGISYNTFDADGKPTNDVASPDWITPDIDDQIGYHAGGGIDVQLTDRVSLFAEYRHVFTDLDTTIDYELLNVSQIATTSESMGYGLAKIGLNISF